MEEVERARERLENIRGVKPILSGLRTISLGSWQAALKRRSRVRAYGERLTAVLPALVPHLQTEQGVMSRLREHLPILRTPSGRDRAPRATRAATPGHTALVVGSERGLCGRFNVAVADETERYLRRESSDGTSIELQVLGSRAQRVLSRRGFDSAQAGTLSVTTLPPISLAFELSRRWLTAYEAHEVDAVYLIYNAYRGTGAYEPSVARLIPPQLPAERMAPSGQVAQDQRPWPPPIIDTDPFSLYATVVEQWTVVRLYSVLLDSSAAEHATRFQLMESATQNADQLIEDLTLVIQTARRQEITQEMAELATGAGLLGRK